MYSSTLALWNLVVVHRGCVVLPINFAYVGQVGRKDICGELSDAELADLFPALGRLLQVALVADANQPVLAEATGVHSYPIVHYSNECVFRGAVWGEDDVNV